MEKTHILILAIGIVLCAVGFFIDIYLGAMGVIILVALAMSFYIMEDTKILPDLFVGLHDDAKQVIVTNRGNAPAYKIHVAIVPLDIEFEIPSLEADKSAGHALDHMINEAKAVAVFEDQNGKRYSRTFKLSALENNDDDLLEPMVPLFRWK